MSRKFDLWRFAWRNKVEAAIKSPITFRVAFVLCELTNETKGFAYPKISDLKNRCHCSYATIKRAIAELEQAGFIHVTSSRGRGHSSEYRLCEKGSSTGSFGTEKGSPMTPFAKIKGVKSTQEKGSSVGLHSNINTHPHTPLAENPSAEGASSAEPRAAESDDDRRAHDAAAFLAAMPHRPDHVAKPSKRILAAYAAALAGGATKDEILAGAHRCKTYHAAKHGNGVCGYAPSPLVFLRDTKWTAAWQLPAPPPAKTRKRSINPNDGDEAREALRREIRGDDCSR